MRLAIAGVPKAGKTPLSHELQGGAGYACPRGGHCLHTDDLIRPGEWSEASAEAAAWFDEAGPFIIEGVAVPRALRKWLIAHADGRPCDRVIWLGTPKIELSPGRLTMAKGCWTVWREVRPGLIARGVEIEER